MQLPDPTALLTAAADAFLEVGTVVAVSLALVGLAQYRTRGALTRWLAAHRRAAPLAGAALGALPGCGGALVVGPLHARGAASFGTLVAALVATMGDSSFVLLATDPGLGLAVHAGLLVTGAATGWLVDALGIRPRGARATGTPEGAAGGLASVARTPAVAGATPAPAGARRSTVGAAAAVTSPTGRLLVRFPSPSLVLLWALVIAGGALVLLELAGVAAGPRLAGLGVAEAVGLAGAATCLAIAVAARGRPQGCGHDRPRTVLVDTAREAAVVTVWVVAAFVVTEALASAGLLELGALPTLGLAGVGVGALVGLVPGCGPQVVLTGLYAQGIVPLPMLAANALSQDGDALLPVLAADRRAALLATAVSTVPGLLVGAGLLALGL